MLPLLPSILFQKCNSLDIAIILCYNSNILIIEVYGDRQNLSKFFTSKKEVYNFAGGTVMEDEVKKLLSQVEQL